MKGQFNLIVVGSKAKPVNGTLIMADRTGDATFYTGLPASSESRAVASIERVWIESASLFGIHLSGYSRVGVKCVHRDWWLRFAYLQVFDDEDLAELSKREGKL